jgi:hypothetical protein
LTSHFKYDILSLIRKNYLKNIFKSSFVPPQKERVRRGKVFGLWNFRISYLIKL